MIRPQDEIAAAYVWDLQFHPGVGKDRLIRPRSFQPVELAGDSLQVDEHRLGS